MTAIERMATPLLLADQLGTIRGKTRLQKLACLLDAELLKQGHRIGYEFQLYHYGPFSFDLMNEVQDLVDEDLLRESTHTFPNGYTEHEYTLTAAGRRFLRSVMSAEPSVLRIRHHAAKIAKANGRLPLSELVARAYAARPDLRAAQKGD